MIDSIELNRWPYANRIALYRIMANPAENPMVNKCLRQIPVGTSFQRIVGLLQSKHEVEYIDPESGDMVTSDVQWPEDITSKQLRMKWSNLKKFNNEMNSLHAGNIYASFVSTIGSPDVKDDSFDFDDSSYNDITLNEEVLLRSANKNEIAAAFVIYRNEKEISYDNNEDDGCYGDISLLELDGDSKAITAPEQTVEVPTDSSTKSQPAAASESQNDTNGISILTGSEVKEHKHVNGSEVKKGDSEKTKQLRLKRRLEELRLQRMNVEAENQDLDQEATNRINSLKLMQQSLKLILDDRPSKRYRESLQL